MTCRLRHNPRRSSTNDRSGIAVGALAAVVLAASKTFLLLEVDPGSHTIVSKTENDAVLKVDAVAGRNYFV